MRGGRGGRTDHNQAEIVTVFRKLGCSVLITAGLGKGMPDLVIGVAGANYLVEVKNPKTDYGRKGLNEVQSAWASGWPAPVYVIRTVDEACALIAELRSVAA